LTDSPSGALKARRTAGSSEPKPKLALSETKRCGIILLRIQTIHSEGERSQRKEEERRKSRRKKKEEEGGRRRKEEEPEEEEGGRRRKKEKEEEKEKEESAAFCRSA
jgi:hypothetical protein